MYNHILLLYYKNNFICKYKMDKNQITNKKNNNFKNEKDDEDFKVFIMKIELEKLEKKWKEKNKNNPIRYS